MSKSKKIFYFILGYALLGCGLVGYYLFDLSSYFTDYQWEEIFSEFQILALVFIFIRLIISFLLFFMIIGWPVWIFIRIARRKMAATTLKQLAVVPAILAIIFFLVGLQVAYTAPTPDWPPVSFAGIQYIFASFVCYALMYLLLVIDWLRGVWNRRAEIRRKAARVRKKLKDILTYNGIS